MEDRKILFTECWAMTGKYSGPSISPIYKKEPKDNVYEDMILHSPCVVLSREDFDYLMSLKATFEDIEKKGLQKLVLHSRKYEAIENIVGKGE
jgi:hypothetical protein